MISPHAIIDPNARIASDVEVGPLCVVGPHVTIGPGCKLISSVTLMGHVTLGRDNVLYPNCVIGAPPQDRKYKGAATRVEIGSGNVFRESVTIHCGTERGGEVTRVGDNNYLMVNVHLGHDVQFGSNCTLANNCMVAGHVVVGDNVVMMGGAAIQQFVTVGSICMLAGYSRIHKDAPPYLKIDGADEIRGVNTIGLRRAGFAEEDIDALEEAVKALFYRRKTPLATAMAGFDTSNGINPRVREMIDFLQTRGRGKDGRSQLSKLRR